YQAARYYHQDPPVAEKEKTPPPAREENFKKSLELYRQIVKDYPRTRTARLARYYIGNAFMELKDYDNAIAAYRSFLDSKSQNDAARGAAYLRLGYAYQSKSNSEEALKAFEAIEFIAGALSKDLAYYEIGLLNESLGRKEKAVASYQEIVKKFPDSLYLAQAQSQLNAMGITEVKPDLPQTKPAGDSAATSGAEKTGPSAGPVTIPDTALENSKVR
ncbi:MAG TPA: tetratricopeptide repeat protein, partial [Nitrospiria bacterium]